MQHSILLFSDVSMQYRNLVNVLIYIYMSISSPQLRPNISDSIRTTLSIKPNNLHGMGQTALPLKILPSQPPGHNRAVSKPHPARPQLRLLVALKTIIEENLRVPLTHGTTQESADSPETCLQEWLVVERDVGLGRVHGVCTGRGSEGPGGAFDARAAEGVGEDDLVDEGALRATGAGSVGLVGRVEGGGPEGVARESCYECWGASVRSRWIWWLIRVKITYREPRS